MKRELTQSSIGIPACALLIMTAANVFAVERKDLIPLIEEASTKQEFAYVEMRDKIVDYGKDAIPILGEIAVDESLPWQQRLIARICYERVEREKEITKLLETDWYKHPKFNPEWNEYLGGPEGHMYGMVVADFKEAGLWYYYLELEWKATGERSTIRDRRNSGYWVSCGTAAVKDNPEERTWFLRVCSEILSMSPPPPRAEWLRFALFREEKPDVAPLLLEVMRDYKGDIFDFVVGLSKYADSRVADTLDKFVEDRPESPNVKYLGPQLAAVRARVAPPPAPEPPFRLGTNIVKRANQP